MLSKKGNIFLALVVSFILTLFGEWKDRSRTPTETFTNVDYAIKFGIYFVVTFILTTILFLAIDWAYRRWTAKH